MTVETEELLVEQDGHGCFALDQELLDASAKYFHADQDRTPTIASSASRCHVLASVADASSCACAPASSVS